MDLSTWAPMDFSPYPHYRRCVQLRTTTSKSLAYLSQLFVLGLIYFITAKGGLSYDAVSGFATLVWPPTGIALAALYLYGYRLWPAITVAAFLVNFLSGAAAFAAIGIAIGNTLEALAGAYCLGRFVRFHPQLLHTRDVLGLALFGGLLAPMISASIGVISLLTFGNLTLKALGSTWLAWWEGDALGNLVVAPALFVWLGGKRPIFSLKKWCESLALVMVTIGTLLFIFGASRFVLPTKMDDALPQLNYLVFPLLIWSAFRLGQRPTVTLGLLIAVVSISLTIAGHGMFQTPRLAIDLMFLSTFVAIVSLTGMLMAAAVAERVAAENCSRDQEEHLRAVVNTALTGIITISEIGTIETFNPAAEGLFGYGKQEVIGKNVRILMPPHLRDRHDSALERYVQTGVSSVIGKGRELLGLRKDGRVFPFFLTLNEMWIRKERKFIGVLHDVTELKRTETNLLKKTAELQRSNRDLESFAFLVSHDLQSPLITVQGFLDLLAKRAGPDLNEKARGWIERAANGSQQMRAMIETILRYSRLSRHQKPHVEVDMNTVFKEVVEALQGEILKAGAHIAKENLPLVKGDPMQLFQLLENLVSNAVKFRSQRPPEIIVSSQMMNNAWMFTVADNGIGIPEESHGRIFDFFERVQSSREYEGHGIGLAICRNIVERHGGKIWLESHLEKGTTFFFTLPVAIDPSYRA